MNDKKMQTRELSLYGVSLRENENGKKIIEGIIPYNQRSEDMGFYEYIAPTAFNKTLADGADVRALVNHDTSKLLGRVKNGSLVLRSEEDGLHIECELPDTSYAEDAYKLIRDGYNTGLSFGFITIQDKWEQKEEDGEMRTVCWLLEVRLLEVSFCVSFPAYESTDSKARSLRSVLDTIKSIKAESLSEEDMACLKEIRELLPEEQKPVSEPEITPAAESTEAEEDKRQLENLLEEIRKLK